MARKFRNAAEIFEWFWLLPACVNGSWAGGE